jgi:uncharacterized protein with LGFP repeats
MRVFSRARASAVAVTVLTMLISGGIAGVAVGELAATQPEAVRAQAGHGPSKGPIKATLESVGSPCGLGSIGAANGWGLPLPAGYLARGSVDQGVDYAAPGGTPECAMGDGTIIGEGGPGLGGFGPWAPILRIDDGPLAGRTVYYGHSGPDLVPVGAHVSSGQQITEVGFGIVGLSTGPHLEIGFYPPGGFGAGGAMLNYINSTGPSDFSSCTVWGGHQVCGAIRDRYVALGGGSVLGSPLTGELPTPDGVGRFNHFSNGWSIYWTPFTGAWSIHGAIRDHWAALGWERSVLGYPVTDETGTPDRIGRFNHFSNNGSIYWTPATRAHEVHGAVRAKWASMGWERGVLGYPIGDEGVTPNKVGRYNFFSGHGAIYWTGPTGAWSIRGVILDKWASMGWENSVLGFPTTDQRVTPNKDGAANQFSSAHSLTNVDGSIYWSSTTGAHEVHGAIRATWFARGAESGCLGYPTSDEVKTAIGGHNTFQRGVIIFDAILAQATASC